MSCSSDSIEVCFSGNKKRRLDMICRRQYCWSDLPQELLEKIIQQNKDNDLSYVARIRAVCKSWRSCTPSPNLYFKPPSPFLASFPFPFSKETEYDFVAALEVIVVDLHPLKPNNPNGGILKLKQKSSGKLRAMHPVTHKKCVSNRGTTVSEVINLLDYRVQLLHRCHYIEDRYSENRRASIHKVVVIRDSICALYGHDNTDNSWLAFLKFGDKEWNKFKGHIFHDMTIYEDNLFAINYFGLLFTVDPLSLRMTPIVANEIEDYYYDCKSYLVESLGDLFLVTLDEPYPLMEVYKLDKANGRWRYVDNLGNTNFFVGDPECLFSISDKDFCGGVCKMWNCLYFFYGWKDESTVQIIRGLSTKSACIYNYDRDINDPDKSISSCPNAMDIFWNFKPRKRSAKNKVFWSLVKPHKCFGTL